jgi:hypothetical protein
MKGQHEEKLRALCELRLEILGIGSLRKSLYYLTHCAAISRVQRRCRLIRHNNGLNNVSTFGEHYTAPLFSWLPFVDSFRNELSVPSAQLLAVINDLPQLSFIDV